MNLPFVPAILEAAAPGVSIPPDLSVVPAPIDYLNITGADVVELLRDGDQNIPVLFSAATSRVVIDFSVEIALKALAMINHNCYDIDDKIKIYGGNSTPAGNLIATIENPDRSVDIFPLMRMNDAFVYDDDVVIPTYRYWEIEFIKAAHPLPYCGEIFVAPDIMKSAYPIDDPGPDFANNVSLVRQNNSFETTGGAAVNYDMKSFLLDIGLSASDHPVTSGSPFLEAIIIPSDIIRRFAVANKTVMVYKQNRTAVFGKLEESQSFTFGEKKSSRQLLFKSELPNDFIIPDP